MRAVLVLAIGLGGCAAGAGGAPGQEWGYAEAHADCAPWDGAATTITLSDAPVGENPTGPYLVISVYRALREAGGTTRIDSQQGQGMSAQLCPADGSCILADEGSVDLTPADSSIRGRYTFRLTDGRRVTGSFTARVVAFRVLCG
jgi:hypothetical protein